MGRWVLHLDLDQFIAAVEVLRRPELAGRPVVVGGRGDVTERAVVSTASYEARAYGVGSGMPLRVAARKLTAVDAVFLPVDQAAYEAASERVMAVLRTFGAVVEVIGWDEAFMGAVTDDPEALARQVQSRVLETTRLRASVGIGQNKLQAKTATAYAKSTSSASGAAGNDSAVTRSFPGIARITGATWFDVLGDQPPEALHGIGTRTARKLVEMGLTTVRALAEAPEADLAARFGPTIGPWLGRRGRGVDPSPVVGDPHVPKSRSREVTYQQNLMGDDEIRPALADVARLMAADIADDGRPVFRVTVKVRWAPFITETRVRKLPAPTADPEELAAAALRVYEAFPQRPPDRRVVRLLGVRGEFLE
jgi:DNA polymerase IV